MPRGIWTLRIVSVWDVAPGTRATALVSGHFGLEVISNHKVDGLGLSVCGFRVYRVQDHLSTPKTPSRAFGLNISTLLRQHNEQCWHLWILWCHTVTLI